jgi:hypothetical protein
VKAQGPAVIDRLKDYEIRLLAGEFAPHPGGDRRSQDRRASGAKIDLGLAMNRMLRTLAAFVAARRRPLPRAGWPAKPVKIVVPFSAATAADIAARQLATRLADAWGQGVVVENVMGAGGHIGAATVAKAAPDGYTSSGGINNVINRACTRTSAMT